jgi:putative transposase
MNNRDYKQFAEGEYYHLYNRGNGKMDIFRDVEDYDFLLARLAEYIQPTMVPIAKSRRRSFSKDAFSLVAYCLMPNHFHFLVRQNTDESLATLMLNLWTGYSKYFNKKYHRVGSIFQDQYKAVHVDNDSYLKWLSVYIHLNPVTAQLVARPEQYQHSSYGEYLGDNNGAHCMRLCEPAIVLDQFQSASAYSQFLSESVNAIKERKGLSQLLIDTI